MRPATSLRVDLWASSERRISLRARLSSPMSPEKKQKLLGALCFVVVNAIGVALALALASFFQGCGQNPYLQERSLTMTWAHGTPVHWGWTTPHELVEPGTARIASACALWPIPGAVVRVVRHPAILPPGVTGIGPAGPTGSRFCTSYRLVAARYSRAERLRVDLGLERPGPVHAEIVLSWRRHEDGSLSVDDASWEIFHLSRGLGDDAPMPAPAPNETSETHTETR